MISKCHLLNKWTLTRTIERLITPSVVLLHISLVFEKQGSYASTNFIQFRANGNDFFDINANADNNAEIPMLTLNLEFIGDDIFLYKGV